MAVANDRNKQLCYTRVNGFCRVTTMQLKGGWIWDDNRGLEGLGTA